MGRYDGYLICTDLDGTFIGSDGELVEKNLAAIDAYIGEGGLFTVSTGRSAAYLEERFGGKIKTNTYIICINGTMIYDAEADKVIYKRHIDRGYITDIDDLTKKFPGIQAMVLHTGRETYRSFADIPAELPVYKVVFVADTENNCLEFKKILEKKYGEVCDFCRSWSTGLEMLPKGAGKGECIRTLRKLLDGRVEKIIAVGDYENDITMLMEADIGYAVANAHEAVKRAADRLTVSNDDGAIAEIIKEIGE